MELKATRYDVSDGVAVVTLARPKRRNAWTGRMHTEYRWILREATTNLLRHSAARRARVTVAPGWLVVEDDGCGLDGDQTGAAEGNGIRGMRERAAAAGGAFRIGPAAGAGTRVEVRW